MPKYARKNIGRRKKSHQKVATLLNGSVSEPCQERQGKIRTPCDRLDLLADVLLAADIPSGPTSNVDTYLICMDTNIQDVAEAENGLHRDQTPVQRRTTTASAIPMKVLDATPFSVLQEQQIAEHVKRFRRPMTSSELRTLAYKVAELSGIPYRVSLLQGVVGARWLQGFLRRHPEVPLCAGKVSPRPLDSAIGQCEERELDQGSSFENCDSKDATNVWREHSYSKNSFAAADLEIKEEQDLEEDTAEGLNHSSEPLTENVRRAVKTELGEEPPLDFAFASCEPSASAEPVRFDRAKPEDPDWPPDPLSLELDIKPPAALRERLDISDAVTEGNEEENKEAIDRRRDTLCDRGDHDDGPTPKPGVGFVGDAFSNDRPTLDPETFVPTESRCGDAFHERLDVSDAVTEENAERRLETWLRSIPRRDRLSSNRTVRSVRCGGDGLSDGRKTTAEELVWHSKVRFWCTKCRRCFSVAGDLEMHTAECDGTGAGASGRPANLQDARWKSATAFQFRNRLRRILPYLGPKPTEATRPEPETSDKIEPTKDLKRETLAEARSRRNRLPIILRSRGSNPTEGTSVKIGATKDPRRETLAESRSRRNGLPIILRSRGSKPTERTKRGASVKIGATKDLRRETPAEFRSRRSWLFETLPYLGSNPTAVTQPGTSDKIGATEAPSQETLAESRPRRNRLPNILRSRAVVHC